jgi:CubicO group peptidase (beta-lactamase class C family)
MKADTLFWIASMSKPITAVAVMMLVDAGKISLDDPVQKYLPDFAPQIEVVSTKGDRVSLKPPARPISLRHVLSHMSGLDFNTAIERPVLDAFPLSVRVKSYGLSQLQFEPGSDFSYSNAGINTAARVVEVVSGMPFEAYLQRHLFNPLGMKDSTFYPSAAQIARLATSYMFADGDGGLEEIPLSQLHAPTYQISRQFVIPAGGLFSTAADIGIFCRMLLNGGVLDGKRYLSESAIHEMVRNQLPDAIARRNGWEQGYGLGWAPGAGGSFGHSGAYATNMSVDPVHGLATIWMVQIAGGAGAASGQAFNKAAIARFSALANQTAE